MSNVRINSDNFMRKYAKDKPGRVSRTSSVGSSSSASVTGPAPRNGAPQRKPGLTKSAAAVAAAASRMLWSRSRSRSLSRSPSRSRSRSPPRSRSRSGKLGNITVIGRGLGREVYYDSGSAGSRSVILRSVAKGPRSHAIVNENLNQEALRRGSKNAQLRRRTLKRAMASLWDAANNVVLLSQGVSITRYAQNMIASKGDKMIIDYFAGKQKRVEAAAGSVRAVAQKLASSTAAACGAIGGGAIGAVVATVIAWPVAFYVGAKAYTAVEKNFAAMVERATSRLFSKSVVVPGLGTPLRGLLSLLNAVPACLRGRFLGTVFRHFVNDVLRMYVGYKFEYYQIAQVALKHPDVLPAFLAGDEVDLRPLVVDLVDGVPEVHLDTLQSAISTKLTALGGGGGGDGSGPVKASGTAAKPRTQPLAFGIIDELNSRRRF